MGLFERKYCDVCGNKIGLLGNRKLSDGNLCRDCRKKLSPWFQGWKSSSVNEIREQLVYREENRQMLSSFQPDQIIGKSVKVMIDHQTGYLTVTDAKDLIQANPDLISFTDILGCDTDLEQYRHEIYCRNGEGKQVSYNPPRYETDYYFHIVIHVRNRYFSEIRFPLNTTPVEVSDHPITFLLGSATNSSKTYQYYSDLAETIRKEILNLQEGHTQT